jgi:hypothetical protein
LRLVQADDGIDPFNHSVGLLLDSLRAFIHRCSLNAAAYPGAKRRP